MLGKRSLSPPINSNNLLRLGSLLACSTGEVAGTEHVCNHFGLEDAVSVSATLSLLHKCYELGIVLKMDLTGMPSITITSIRINK